MSSAAIASNNKKSSKRSFFSLKKDKQSSRSSRSSKSKSEKGHSERNARSAKEINNSSTSQKRKPSKKNDAIHIFCRDDMYDVKLEQFARFSKLIERELATGTVPTNIDLSKYDKNTVKILVDHIESREVKTGISFYSLAELLKLSKVFEMANLRDQLQKLVLTISAKDTASLHQILLVAGIAPLDLEVERAVLALAASKYHELSANVGFQQIHFKFMVELVASCELNVASEIEVVDSILLWLAGQPTLTNFVPALFSLIRHCYIPEIQKAFILERARALRFSDEAVSSISRIFASTNGLRVCAVPEHKATHIRCRDPADYPKESAEPKMPLSLPRPEILYKPEVIPQPYPALARPVQQSFKPAGHSSRKSLSSRALNSQSSKRSQRSKKGSNKASVKSVRANKKKGKNAGNSKSSKSSRSTHSKASTASSTMSEKSKKK